MGDGPRIDVIVPTRGDAGRADLLRRAVDSIVAQDGVTARPLVVVNGPHADPEVVRALEGDPQIRTVRVPSPGLANALRVGRESVEAPLFGALDDDDVLLPGALRSRAIALAADDHLDVVVTNGLVRTHSGDSVHIPRLEVVQADPAAAMVERNWLLPGSWLARTDRVPVAAFLAMPDHAECTWLGLWFATRQRMALLAEPTVVWHSDTPGGAHRARQFRHGQTDGITALLALPLPAPVRDAFRRRIADVAHDSADHEYHHGSLRAAWSWHLRSLAARGGLRYLPFTLRLLGLRGNRR